MCRRASKKVDDGQVHAAVLAAAGLHWLEANQHITAYLDAPDWLPAPGQGAIAIQIRTDDDRARRTLGALNHAETMVQVTAERAMLGALEGGCQVPIGALAASTGREAGRELVLHGLIATIDGTRILRGHEVVDPAAPAGAGEALARHLRALGAAEILGGLRALTTVPAPQPE